MQIHLLLRLVTKVMFTLVIDFLGKHILSSQIQGPYVTLSFIPPVVNTIMLHVQYYKLMALNFLRSTLKMLYEGNLVCDTSLCFVYVTAETFTSVDNLG